MPLLHDPDVRTRIEERLRALSPDAPRQWGKMTADQMLWHVNQLLSFTVGESTAPNQKQPIPLPLFRFVVTYLPWPKGAPTHDSAVAKSKYDFESERARCLGLVGRFASKPIDDAWPVHPMFGTVTGTFASRLAARHLDHHLRQFGC